MPSAKCANHDCVHMSPLTCPDGRMAAARRMAAAGGARWSISSMNSCHTLQNAAMQECVSWRATRRAGAACPGRRHAAPWPPPQRGHACSRTWRRGKLSITLELLASVQRSSAKRPAPPLHLWGASPTGAVHFGNACPASPSYKSTLGAASELCGRRVAAPKRRGRGRLGRPRCAERSASECLAARREPGRMHPACRLQVFAHASCAPAALPCSLSPWRMRRRSRR